MSVRRVQRKDSKTGVLGEFWLVDVDLQLPNGQRQRVRKVSPIPTRRGAMEYERELRNALLAGEYNKEVQSVPNLREFSKEYLKVHTLVQNKKSGYANVEAILRLHLLPAMGDLALDQIGVRDVAHFTAAQIAKGLSHSSVNNHLILLRSMLGKALEWQVISSIPKVKKLPKTPQKFRYLDFDETRRLIDAAAMEPDWQTAIVVALNTGLRLGELIALQWDDLDLVALTLSVQRSDWQGHLGSPKSGKARVIPLNHSVALCLKKHRHLRGPWVFCNQAGERRKNSEFASAIRRIRKRAGLPRFEWHALRHTFASHLAMRAIPLLAIQELMGHASMQMTQRYAHLSPEFGRHAVIALDEPAPNTGRDAAADALGAFGIAAVGSLGNESHGNITASGEKASRQEQTKTAPIFQSEPAVNFGSGGRI